MRTVSRARARWVRNDLGHTLIFDELMLTLPKAEETRPRVIKVKSR